MSISQKFANKIVYICELYWWLYEL